MSRIGSQPIVIPNGVTITTDNDIIRASGPRGSLSQPVIPGVSLKLDGSMLTITRQNDTPAVRACHGLTRALVSNMVLGVSQGFEKKLELTGVGYRATLVGNALKFNLGLSHEIVYDLPADVVAKVEQNIIILSGVDKQRVGQVAAEIRHLKKPEPYKGKGIKYVGERIIRKSGKSGKEK